MPTVGSKRAAPPGCMTKVQLADALGVTPMTIDNWRTRRDDPLPYRTEPPRKRMNDAVPKDRIHFAVDATLNWLGRNKPRLVIRLELAKGQPSQNAAPVAAPATAVVSYGRGHWHRYEILIAETGELYGGARTWDKVYKDVQALLAAGVSCFAAWHSGWTQPQNDPDPKFPQLHSASYPGVTYWAIRQGRGDKAYGLTLAAKIKPVAVDVMLLAERIKRGEL